MEPKQNRASLLDTVGPLTLVALLGCSEGNPGAGVEVAAGANGGARQTAGATAVGGSLTSVGGTSGTTAVTTAGGGGGTGESTGGRTTASNSVTGGARAAGGTGGAISSAANTGGRPGSGGMPVTGGVKGSGGTRATGGAATAGTSAATTSSGGSSGGAAMGGSQSLGGSGGRAGLGGTGLASGGSSASGGTSGSAHAPITIWMAGDSTMMNCSNSVCPCGWGNELASYFNESVTVTNRSVGGRSVQTWLYGSAVTDTLSGGDCLLSSDAYDSRWTSMLASMKPGDYLMIAFGINDGDTKCPRHVSSARFQSLLDVMVKAAKEKRANPILLTPTDAIECSGTTVLQKRGFLTETKAVATADGVSLIDLNQLSMTLYASLGLCPNDGNYTSTTSVLGKFFCEDHTHFEAAGARQIAGLVVSELRTQGIGLAGYLK